MRSLVTLETQLVAVQARQAALASVIPEEQKKLPQLTETEREFTRLTRSVQVLETSYTSLESRFNDFRVQEQMALDHNPVTIVDIATSAQPASPSRTVVRVLVAGMLGLFGGIGLVVFQTQIDNTVKTAEDAERLLGTPVLTSVVKHNPPFDEAYQVLKTALGLHGSNGSRAAIMFTGTRVGAGTSTVVYHLARAIARSGKRVVVVDADLRRPTAHRLFGVTVDAGLVDALTGAVPVEAALQPSTIENVRVLPAGQSSSLPLVDLFGPPAMAGLLDELRRHADVILIDSPPPVPFAESRALAALVDGVVLVLAAGQAPRGVEVETKRELERVHARVLGVVVNKVAPENDDSYYLYGNYHTPVLPSVPSGPPTGGLPTAARGWLLAAGLGVGGAAMLETNLMVALGVGGMAVLLETRHVIDALMAVLGWRF